MREKSRLGINVYDKGFRDYHKDKHKAEVANKLGLNREANKKLNFVPNKDRSANVVTVGLNYNLTYRGEIK